MEDPKELNPNAKGDLNEASDHEIDYQQPYAQTDEYQDDCKRVPSLHLEERCELDDESDNYWDAYEEINEHKEAHGEDASPQSREVKEASKNPTNNADHKEENYINSSLQFETDNDPDYSRDVLGCTRNRFFSLHEH